MSAVEERKALVAMSGGVDSSVAVRLLQQQGYVCHGITMRLNDWTDEGCDSGRTCCAQKDIVAAARAALRLGISHEVLDCREEFRARVIEPFVRTYEEGGTPNPCIECNRSLKFETLLHLALSRGMECLATGHYARIEYDKASGLWQLKKALDNAKDQSYVLYMLSQSQLERLRFPLGGLIKTETRAMAESLGLCNARKPDSQDICFVPDGNYVGFMERYRGRPYPPGDIVDLNGRTLGRHKGAVRYTPGQRKGLGLALGEPAYVCGKDMAANTVSVGPEAALYSSALTAAAVNWVSGQAPEEPRPVQAKTRYGAGTAEAVVYPLPDGRFRLEFDRLQRALTAGQAAVLYDGELVLGGGTICEVER
ncbi:MAG: tRNA 2-thiouridine(34) synthase MnmA [Firmicutes bacterium]|nr:tRNA 2-thiouridine(34) synthase MnmA [Bacillota bacterium]